MPRARMMKPRAKGIMVRFLYLFLLLVLAIPSWGLVAAQQHDNYRYDGSRTITHTQNCGCGVVQKLSGDGGQQTIWALSDKAQGESFFTFVDGFFVAKRPVVIGENMKDRVIPAAKKLGADYYKPRKTKGDPLKKNERWIDDKMREGRKIIDIGPDPKRSKRSPFYEAEKRRIERRN